jgi:hypothetical protein
VTTVASLDDVKSAISKLAIFDDTTFKRRVTLDTDADWSEFAESCRDDQDTSAYNLELLLKKCYSATYSMPSPPSLLRPSRTGRSGSSSPSALAI